MTRNLKALGLALLAICALGAVVAQGASAVNHQFKSDGATILTGKNKGKEKFQVGAAGTVECETSEFEATSPTANEETLTVTPRYSGCKFGGQDAFVFFNHCAYIFSSDTTGGTEEGKEHATVEIECAHKTEPKTEAISKIEIHTAVCTITVEEQVVPHAVSYKKDTASSTIVNSTAKNIVTGKARTTPSQPLNGCLTFPSGAIGTYTGESTVECFKDKEGSQPLTGTTKTTPQGLTEEDGTTACSVE